MQTKDKIEIRISEVRARLNQISDLEGDAITGEIRSEAGELKTEYADLETRFQAATIGGAPTETRTENSEDRALRRLIGGASVGAVYAATIEHRQTDGATAELQQHHGLGANQIALAMLRGDEPEVRAATQAPANVAQQQSEIVPAVFPQACATFLGVDTPVVGVGEAVYPVLATSAVTGAPAEGATPSGTGIDSDGSTTGSFTAEALSPGRLQAQFFYSREDRARFVGMDAGLRMNLSDALADALDKQIIAGVNGLLNGTNLANNDVSAQTNFEAYLSDLVYGRIDGTYASMTSEIRVVLGATTNAHAGGVYRNTSVDRNALDRLMEITGGVKVSAHVPAVASMKQNAIVRRGMRRDMVAPIWEGVTLIPDEVTKAASGQIVITAVMLHAVKILRAAGFHKQAVKVAA